mmetsp:Transcript_22781/g.49185  ORF Transcript_22781/g.49185 Transcript_22781/m.49185 type:complete len:212 (-) Transcript_22781:45-680(-)
MGATSLPTSPPTPPTRAPLDGRRSVSSRSTSSRRRSSLRQSQMARWAARCASSARRSRARCPPRPSSSAGSASSPGDGPMTGATPLPLSRPEAGQPCRLSCRRLCSRESRRGCSALRGRWRTTSHSHTSCPATSTRLSRPDPRRGSTPSARFARAAFSTRARYPKPTSPSSESLRTSSWLQARSGRGQGPVHHDNPRCVTVACGWLVPVLG